MIDILLTMIIIICVILAIRHMILLHHQGKTSCGTCTLCQKGNNHESIESYYHHSTCHSHSICDIQNHR